MERAFRRRGVYSQTEISSGPFYQIHVTIEGRECGVRSGRIVSEVVWRGEMSWRNNCCLSRVSLGRLCRMRSVVCRHEARRQAQARQERGHAVWKERSNDLCLVVHWLVASADFS
jgi:hypothetical protein